MILLRHNPTGDKSAFVLGQDFVAAWSLLYDLNLHLIFIN